MNFVENRLASVNVDFHSKLPHLKILTMADLGHCSPGLPEMLAVEKHNRYLLQRLLVAKDTGRDVDLRNDLQEEISAVPLSLADKTGIMRSCAKAALLHILEKGFVEVAMPATTM